MIPGLVGRRQLTLHNEKQEKNQIQRVRSGVPTALAYVEQDGGAIVMQNRHNFAVTVTQIVMRMGTVGTAVTEKVISDAKIPRCTGRVWAQLFQLTVTRRTELRRGQVH